jgi:hypothetical protein
VSKQTGGGDALRGSQLGVDRCYVERVARLGSELAVRRIIVLKCRPMRRLIFGVVLCVTSIALGMARTVRQDTGTSGNAKQNEKSVRPEAVQGCYALAMSPWFPAMRLGDDEQLITPPSRIQLLAEKGTEGEESRGYLVRAAPGVQPSVHSSMYWLPKGSKTLEITFTDGFSGLVMGLKTSDAETLHGKATTFWDFDRRRQVAEVMARRVPCGK